MDKLKKRRLIIVSIIALLLILITLIICLSMVTKPKEQVDSEEQALLEIEEDINNMQIHKLSGMEERDRIDYYVSNFVQLLQYKDYETAYELLNKDFKDNFFPTLDSFKDYAKKRFYSEISVEYENIERAGDIYVVWANMTNLLGKSTNKDSINFVIKENDLNNYEISFSVNRK